MRNMIFNENWKFNLGECEGAYGAGAEDTQWETVSLPHDFSIIQPFTIEEPAESESGFLPGGTGWYRKHFIMAPFDAGKTFVLSFDGVYQNTYVYVNGIYVGENHNGYNSFGFDITKHLLCDGITDNVIAVKVVHELPSSRYYSGSGIYRNVTLEVTDPVHIGMNGTYITTPKLAEEKDGEVTVYIEAEVVNDSRQEVQARVCHTVLDANGAAVSETADAEVLLKNCDTSVTKACLQVHAPSLWSPESPVLYQIKTEVQVEGKIVDTYYSEFGFRYFEFDADKGFYLNGEAVKIKGVCMHHDQGALGAIAHEDAMERQLMILKDMGCNAVRTSHNIPAEIFIHLCNKWGFLVMEEAFDGWSAPTGDNEHDFSEYFKVKLTPGNTILNGSPGQTWAEFTLKSMIKRDRNAPSVILWDIGNEIMNTEGDTSDYVEHAQNLITWIQSMDMTRPITHGDNMGVVTTESTHTTAQIDRLLAASGGVVGFNYWPENLPVIHGHYPDWKLISTETVSTLNSRGGYSLYHINRKAQSIDGGPYFCSAYDNWHVSWGSFSHEGWYQNVTNDCDAGEFIWTGFDYIGEPNPWWSGGPGAVTELGAAPNSAYFGVLDTAGFAKDRYYFYRSQWNQKDTTLHLVTAWDPDNCYLEEGKTPVWIYSNAAKIELYREDKKGNVQKLAVVVRSERKTAVGHCYGIYESFVESGAESDCVVVDGSGSSAFSARFFVTFEAGAVYAVAYDKEGQVITDTVGNARVNTPGETARIAAYADKTKLVADGYCLSYITLDITDRDGNLDTTASNQIEISLKGAGEIVGVDNGDPATIEKYQQKTVLKSASEAVIRAYAGKALVIIRSTKTPGEIVVTAESEGLEATDVRVVSTTEGIM